MNRQADTPMGHTSKTKLFLSTAISFCLLNIVHFNLPASHLAHWLNTDSTALAKSSGGRSGGGSFRSSGSSSRSSGSSSRSSGSSSRSTTPSRSSGSSNRSSGSSSSPSSGRSSRPNYNSGYNYNTTTSTTSSDGDAWLGLLVLLILIGGLVAIPTFLLIMFLKAQKKGSSGVRSADELDNDIVTVSKIQVALLAEARDVQAKLTDISLSIDTDTPEGLWELMQESTLALLRTPENWTHVLASSKTVPSPEEAETVFNQLSVAERSKFSAETLSNVRGKTRQQAVQPDADEDPAAYIVVTLLIGTADDRPLFTEVRSAETLRMVLEKIAAIPQDYLMVFELLWSPQDASDSLTHDELLTEYTDMIQIA